MYTKSRDRMRAAILQQREERMSYLRRQLAKGNITKEEYEQKAHGTTTMA